MSFFDDLSFIEEDEQITFERFLYPEGAVLKMCVKKGDRGGGCAVFEKTLIKHELNRQDYFAEQLTELLELVRSDMKRSDE